MRHGIAALTFLALCMAGTNQAQAASCASFVTITKYDEAASTVDVSWEKGKQRKFFPKPSGTPTGPSKIPGKCRKKVTKINTFPVKATGGRLSMTQVRSNFQGTMQNDADDESWLPTKLKQLLADKTKVVAVFRPGMGKDAGHTVTTIYLPITDEELAEIKRLEEQAEDL